MPIQRLSFSGRSGQPAIPPAASALALDHGSDGVLIADMRMRDQLIVHVNPAFESSHNAVKRVIVESVVKLGAALDLRVVAEGIETEAECAIVRALGCSIGQGYLFAAPMEEPQFQKVLDQRLLVHEVLNAQRLPPMPDADGVKARPVGPERSLPGSTL